jgi:hypothetical protein
LTLTVNEKVPALVGVPEIGATASIVRPSGSAPSASRRAARFIVAGCAVPQSVTGRGRQLRVQFAHGGVEVLLVEQHQPGGRRFTPIRVMHPQTATVWSPPGCLMLPRLAPASPADVSC